ncbi:hypothetical protein OROGR_026596 [Orobanche gracilis]
MPPPPQKRPRPYTFAASAAIHPPLACDLHGHPPLDCRFRRPNLVPLHNHSKTRSPLETRSPFVNIQVIRTIRGD